MNELIDALDKGSRTGDKLATVGIALAIIEIFIGIVIPLITG